MSKEIQQIDPEIYRGLILVPILELVGADKIDEFCNCVNNLRSGKTETTTVSNLQCSRLNFKSCVMEQTSPSTMRTVLKIPRPDLKCGSTEFVIYLTNERSNYIVKKNKQITWHCRKDEGKFFPKAGREFLKIKFSHIGVNMVNTLLLVHDSYIKTYNQIILNEAQTSHG